MSVLRGDVVPGSTSRLTTVDHRETYGRHVLAARLRGIRPQVAVDLGCGLGGDLALVKAAHPDCALHGVDFGPHNADRLRGAGITLHVTLQRGRNVHHIIEATFKGLARCLRDAVRVEGAGVPSTKGVL